MNLGGPRKESQAKGILKSLFKAIFQFAPSPPIMKRDEVEKITSIIYQTLTHPGLPEGQT
jgi:hypothetical protein